LDAAIRRQFVDIHPLGHLRPIGLEQKPRHPPCAVVGLRRAAPKARAWIVTLEMVYSAARPAAGVV
jgi:hypothetical protein